MDTQEAVRTLIFGRQVLIAAGEAPLNNVLIEVADGRIVRLSADANHADVTEEGKNGANVIDLSCCFLMPGFIDVQTHLESQPGLPSRIQRMTEESDASVTLRAMENARKTLIAGFTTIRDMGHSGRSVYAVRSAIDRGRIMGPRMQVAGQLLMPTGGELRPWLRPDVEALYQGPHICNGPYDCKRAVRAAVALGATTIKVATKQDLAQGSDSQFDLAELTAIREAANSLGVKVTASAFSTDSINRALEAGFDGIVHGVFMNDRSFSLLAETGAFLIPTLLAARVVKEIAEDATAPVDDAWRAENLRIYDGMVQSFRRALDSGVKIAFGTDAGWRPHGGNAEQLVQMVDLGMAPSEVLASATLLAAEAMGWGDRVGKLHPGMFADIVATRASPLVDMTTVLAPVMVIKGGQAVSR